MDGTLELFFLALDDSIRYIQQNEPNDAWQPVQMFGGQAQQLCSGQDADGRFELLYVGMDGYCYHYWQTQVGTWTGVNGGNAAFQASYLSATTDSSGPDRSLLPRLCPAPHGPGRRRIERRQQLRPL